MSHVRPDPSYSSSNCPAFYPAFNWSTNDRSYLMPWSVRAYCGRIL